MLDVLDAVTDSTTAVVQTAASRLGPARLKTWVQLTGIFDAIHGQLQLYVNGGDGRTAGNGLPAGSTPPGSVRPWAAPAIGAFRLGSAFQNGLTQAWRGRLTDVCAFFGPVPSADVKLLYSGNAANPHNGCAALDAKYP